MSFSHFIYQLIAIINEMSPYVLLGFFIAGLLHAFVSPDTMSRHLAGNGWKPVFKAALFGIPLPLCSCGVLPTAVSLRRRGASRAAATSFLIATPQTGVDSIAATYSLLGLPFAIIRPIAALVGAVFGGIVVEKTDTDNTPTNENTLIPEDNEQLPHGFFAKIVDSIKYGFIDMVASVGKWLVIGLVVAALITVFVPDSLFLSLNKYPIVAMLVMVVIAVPMYICATGSIPIALSLMLKGLSPGVAFVLLMAGPAANFASIIILRKTFGSRATWAYVASVIISAIAFGLIIDYLLPADWFIPKVQAVTSHSHIHFNWFSTSCSVVLICLLIYTAIRPPHNHSHKHTHDSTTNVMTRTYKIKGMACAHCQASVTRTIAALPGVTDVNVDLSAGTATVTGDIDPQKVIEAIRIAGFEPVED